MTNSASHKGISPPAAPSSRFDVRQIHRPRTNVPAAYLSTHTASMIATHRYATPVVHEIPRPVDLQAFRTIW
jgi:hypothetical protein